MNFKKYIYLFALSSCLACTKSFAWQLQPYGGIDYGIQNSQYKQKFGDNLLKKKLPKGNLFLGLKLNDYFGIEAGYETTIKNSKTTNLSDFKSFFGTTIFDLNEIQSPDYQKTQVKQKISGMHLGLTIEYPLFIINNPSHHSLSLVGYLGVKNAKADIKINSSLFYEDDIQIDDPVTLNHNHKKTILRLACGLQFSINDNFGIRLLGSWENTSKLKPEYTYPKGTKLTAKLKDSFGYSIGFVAKVL